MSFRAPLVHDASENFTMKRGEYKHLEDLRLIKHFASWLSVVGNRPVAEISFEEDLMDGTVLCSILIRIRGSGVTTYHGIKGDFSSLAEFKKKENLVTFEAACKRLNLPVSFGYEDLEKSNIQRVVSTLIFLSHSAWRQGQTITAMDKELLDRIEELDQALGLPELSWFHKLMVKLGLGDWINFLSKEGIQEYLATLKKNMNDSIENANKAQKNLVNSIEETKKQIVEKLPDPIKAKIASN